MHKISFDLETITPLFMAGADGKTPELRPPSFKGMMRFWWRAMRAEDDIEKLSKDEAAIFGGTKVGEGKSKVSIKLIYESMKASDLSLLPHKNARFRLRAIETKQKFKCILHIQDQYQKVATAALKLSLLLGGMGKRSRRGFGSLSYKRFEDYNEIIKEIEQANIIAGENRRLCKKKSNSKNTIILGRLINQENPIYPRIYEIYLGHEGSSSFNSILEKIGTASSKHRDNAIGSIKPYRVASPIVATIVKADNKFYRNRSRT